MSLFDLTGKIAAVIGGASGIGEAVARGAAEHGASVVVLGANGGGGRAVASPSGGSWAMLDIREADAVRGALDAIVLLRGALDIVICTPSINVRKPILQYSEEEFDRVVDVNLKGS